MPLPRLTSEQRESRVYARLLNDSTAARMKSLADELSEVHTEVTGRPKVVIGPDGQRETIGGRFRGVKPHTELKHFKETPKQIRQAIRRGKGKLFREVKKTVRTFLDQDQGEYLRAFAASRVGQRIAKETSPAKRREWIAPHVQIRACRFCGVPHSFSKHHSHGPGSFAATHRAYPLSWDIE